MLSVFINPQICTITFISYKKKIKNKNKLLALVNGILIIHHHRHIVVFIVIIVATCCFCFLSFYFLPPLLLLSSLLQIPFFFSFSLFSPAQSAVHTFKIFP